MLAYQSTVQYVKKWVADQNEEGTPTMLISVSDHETGGLALGRQLDVEIYPEYLWSVPPSLTPHPPRCLTLPLASRLLPSAFAHLTGIPTPSSTRPTPPLTSAASSPPATPPSLGTRSSQKSSKPVLGSWTLRRLRWMRYGSGGRTLTGRIGRWRIRCDAS